MTRLALEVATTRGYDDTVEACRAALVREGFGVLTEIDLAATLKAKLDVDRTPYLILGACHPPSAKQLVEIMPQFGVLLPCNVTISVEDGQTLVRAMDPAGIIDTLLPSSGLPSSGDQGVAEVREIAHEIAGRLDRALASLD